MQDEENVLTHWAWLESIVTALPELQVTCAP